jgi:hypothetical protein
LRRIALLSANDLFENRGFFAEALKKFPRCQPLVPLLRHLSGERSLEQVLAAYESEARHYPERYKQIMAVRYYLAYVIKLCEEKWETVHNGVTNFKTLLDQIERWRYQNNEKICLVTFNYDTMLDAACVERGFLRLERFDGYVTGNYMLVKPHGSINWGRTIVWPPGAPPHSSPQVIADTLIDRAAAPQVFGPHVLVRSQPPQPDYSHREVICPAIAIPIENKGKFECPDGHVETLKQCLPLVTKMLTIGWRATEEHFLALLRDGMPQQPDLMVIAANQNEAREIAEKLQPSRLNVDLARGGFTESVLSRAIEEFLSRQTSAPIMRDLWTQPHQ